MPKRRRGREKIPEIRKVVPKRLTTSDIAAILGIALSVAIGVAGATDMFPLSINVFLYLVTTALLLWGYWNWNFVANWGVRKKVSRAGLGLFIYWTLLAFPVYRQYRKDYPDLRPIFFSMYMLRNVDEDTALSTDVSGTWLIVQNPTESTVRDLSLIVSMPPISTSESDSLRFTIEGGGKTNATFIHVSTPELNPRERHIVKINFLRPQPFRSAETWKREYGYPDHLDISQIYIGKEHPVQ